MQRSQRRMASLVLVAGSLLVTPVSVVVAQASVANPSRAAYPSLALVGDTDGLSFSERARRRQLEIERDALQRDLARGHMSATARQRKQQRLRQIEQALRSFDRSFDR